MYLGTVIRSDGSFVVFLVMVTLYDEEFPDGGHVNITLPDMNFVDISCDFATKQTIDYIFTFLLNTFLCKNRNNC